MKPEKDWVFSAVEPIVPEELWAQCNQILDDRHNGKRPAKKAVQLFAGLAFCYCGQKMYVPSNTPKYICYRCRNKIGVGDLEGVFHEQLKSFFFSPTETVKYLEQADHTIKEKLELQGTLEQERQKVRDEMDKTYRLYIGDQISAEGFGRQYKPLEEYLELAENAYLKYQLGIPQEKRDLLRIVTSNREVHEKKLEISLSLPYQTVADRWENSNGGPAGS